ncbi:OmpA family protein [Chitinophaga tropicalis]|uniref:OmpA family protein n=1 Tax=Chitinophaga tropicalis TaxID=2683588 RepID=A0A7K1U279_9BACT|nr:OmpA family protein [Chitinophaga tropicalis]MVT08453.1 OmpA family protein [Chitinophaga tropicalis]
MKRSHYFISLGLLLSSYNAKSQYIIKEADKQYESYKYAKAIELYEEAYKKKATLHAAERLADCYRLNNNYVQAEAWYAKAVAMPGSKTENILYYAQALQNNSRYAEARTQYISYANADKQVTEARMNAWISSCDSAISWMKEPVAAKVSNYKPLNSAQSDWSPVAYMGGLVFTSDRYNSSFAHKKPVKYFLKFDTQNNPDPYLNGWTGNDYMHLFYKAANADTVQAFPLNTGTGYHVGSATFTEDGNEMYFTLTRIPEKVKNVKGEPFTVNVEIYSSKKDASGQWSALRAFPYNKVSEYSVADPFISPDGNTLYFASNMPGGQGATDIYMCTRTVGGEWGAPVNLKEINTAGNDRSPAIDKNNTFFFASDGRIGMGGLDIYSVSQNGAVRNLGYPINSPQDDFAFSVSADGVAWFSSNRDGGAGRDDIYAVAVVAAPPLPPKKDTIREVPVAMPDNTPPPSTAIGKPRMAQVGDPIYDKPTMIYFDFNKFDIRSDSRLALDKIIEAFNNLTDATLVIESHTDSRGNDAFNLKLSQQRAAAVVKYLTDRGVKKANIEAQGYGETRLLNKCADGVECTEFEHEENRRTNIRIVR